MSFLYLYPPTPIFVTVPPITFIQDNVPTEVEQDTLNPNNNIPLPVDDISGNVLLSSIESELQTISVIDFSTAAKQDALLAELQLKADLTETQPVSLVSIPLASGASTEAKQDTGNTSLSSIDGKIIEDGTIITSNSSTTPLGSNAVFTGSAFEVTKYSAINVGVYSDVASATNGVKVEFSPDGTNWDHSHSTTYSAVSGIGYIFNCEYKYARVVYTNGTSAQGSFRLQTIVKKNFTGPSLYTIDQSVNGNMFASLGKNVIIGKSTAGGGTFVDVKVNPSGSLTVEASLSAGTNNIGDVDVVSLPSIPAGNNNIGDVDVASLPVSFNTGAADATTQRVVIASSQTVPVSAASLPLPTGAATDAKLDTIITTLTSTNTKLDSIETNTSPELNSHSTQTVTSASAVTFTAPAGAKRMVIQNSLAAGGAIRFVASANTPTASSGFYLGVGQSTSEVAAGSFKAIATTASEDGDVTVIWFV